MSQLVGVILIHCLDECNKAKLARPAYESKLKAMLKERGVDIDVTDVLNSLLED